METGTLEERIKAEMTVDYNDALEKKFDTAKKMIGITPEGKVSLLQDSALGGEDRIVLYLIGKVYAKRVGYVQEDWVSNKELLEELGLKEGSLFPWLKFLREANKIKQKTVGKSSVNFIPYNLIGNELDRIWKKLNK